MSAHQRAYRAAVPMYDPTVQGAVMDELAIVLLVIMGVFGVLWVVSLPMLIAYRRKHRNRYAIAVMTGVGWFVWPFWFGALVWAFTNDVEHQP